MKITLIALALLLTSTKVWSLVNEYAKYKSTNSSDDITIAYNVHGKDKPSLILVHGWSCDSRYWHKQISNLTAKYQVITVDLAGHGNSSVDRASFTIQSFANDVIAVLKQEQINDAILIGHSMGAAVVATAAKSAPDRVKGIIAVDSLHNVANDISANTVTEMLTSFEQNFRQTTQDFVLSMFPEKKNKELINWVKQDMSSAPSFVANNAMKNYFSLYVGAQFSQTFDSFDKPVISINSRLWPTNANGNQKAIKNYQLTYIEDVGHFPMLEKPEEFNLLLNQAIETINSTQGNKFTSVF